MKRVTTRDVPSYWASGIAACNNGSQFWTDGVKLYSYQLMIGDTVTLESMNKNMKVLRDYSANGRHGFKSMTTSKHVGYARRAADYID